MSFQVVTCLQPAFFSAQSNFFNSWVWKLYQLGLRVHNVSKGCVDIRRQQHRVVEKWEDLVEGYLGDLIMYSLVTIFNNTVLYTWKLLRE